MKEWEVDTQGRPGTASLRGIFRLESSEAYDSAFAAMRAGLEAAGSAGYTVDITQASLMNSSGIRALADLVMLARRADLRVTFVAKRSVPWQRKTVASLESLHERMTVTIL